jgi:hypothetical protein
MSESRSSARGRERRRFHTGAALGVSLFLVGVGAVSLLVAMAFANSEADQIPHGLAEQVVWLALPLGGLAAATWSMIEAAAALSGEQRLARWGRVTALAVGCFVGGGGYATILA